jgi:predicted N-acetyltransferase YhbS
MDQETIAFIAFDDSHLDGATLLSREAGWPHRREDWAMALSLSQGFVALQGKTVIGTVMMTPFGADAATINLVIVAEAARGRGLGRRLMDEALAAAGACEVRLVATADGLPLYEKLGFERTHEIRQHQGVVAGGQPSTADIAWAEAQDMDVVAALDRQALGLDRHRLLQVLARDGRIALLRKDGRIVGYGALRTFGRGDVIGPVIADDIDGAKALISFFIDARPGAFLRIDTPLASGLSAWLVEQGLAQAGGGIAMRRGATAPQPAGPARLFALASQALG